MEDKIEIGDICMLNAGGHAMTVTGSETVDGREFIRMYWHDREGKPHATALAAGTFVLLRKRAEAQADTKSGYQRQLAP